MKLLGLRLITIWRGEKSRKHRQYTKDRFAFNHMVELLGTRLEDVNSKPQTVGLKLPKLKKKEEPKKVELPKLKKVTN